MISWAIGGLFVVMIGIFLAGIYYAIKDVVTKKDD